MRAAIYTRVSSREQVDGYSLSAQEEVTRQFAAMRGWEVVAVYQEPGRSGRTAHRPVFQKMILDAETGAFDVILVHKLDRFSRSLLDVLTYLDRLGKFDVSFVSATEQFDFTTPLGRVMLAVLGAFAQWYLDNLRTEIVKGKKERARQGNWNGRLSFGYTTPARLRQRLLQPSLSEQDAELVEITLEKYDDLNDTDALPCPFDAGGVRLAYDLYATGKESHKSVAQALNDAGYRVTTMGGNLFSAATVRDMLSNRFYLGETSYYGGNAGGRKSKREREWLPGIHEPIISNEHFNAVQETLRRRARKFAVKQGLQKQFYPLAGLLVDECDITWRGTFNHGKRYYRQRQERAKQKGCNAGRKTMVAAQLEGQIQDVLNELEIPETWLERAKSRQEPIYRKVDAKKLTAKLERVKKLFIEGDLSEDEYYRLRDEIQTKLTQADEIVEVPTRELDVMYETIRNVGKLWAVATDEERCELAAHLFERLDMDSGEIKQITPISILSALIRGGVDRNGEDRLLTILGTQVRNYVPLAA